MRRALVGILVLAAAIAGVVAWTGHGRLVPFLTPDRCQATVSGRTVLLTQEQAENASLIAAIAVRRGLPARAVSIALATAYQESKILNLEEGDRDSLGIFQQRPSQGWGSEKQLLDPVYATNAFYDALVKVDDYEDLPITVAAQEVQRSAFPNAYADHEADARVLASALTGNSPHALWCEGVEDPRGRTSVVREEARGVFDLAATSSARRVEITTSDATVGWAVAQYFVAQADRLGITRVQMAGHTWTASADRGWSSGSTSSDRIVVEVGA